MPIFKEMVRKNIDKAFFYYKCFSIVNLCKPQTSYEIYTIVSPFDGCENWDTR